MNGLVFSILVSCALIAAAVGVLWLAGHFGDRRANRTRGSAARGYAVRSAGQLATQRLRPRWKDGLMAWTGNTHRAFTTVAAALIRERADDSTLHDVLAALMDHIGVPMMLLQHYRDVPAIVALFAERGVTLAVDRG